MNPSDQEKLNKKFDSVADMTMELQNKAYELGRLRGRREVQDKIDSCIRVLAWNKQGQILAASPGLGDDDSDLNATLILDDGVVL